MPERTKTEARYLCKEEILQDFKDSIKGIENLKCPMDDEFLLKFLIARKYRLNDALKLLKRYFEIRKQHRQLILCICPLTLRDIYEIEKVTLVLKHRDDLGRKVILQRNGLWNPDLVSFDELVMFKFYILEEVISCPETQKHGVVVISDDSDLTFALSRRILYEWSYKRLRLVASFLQGSFPGRFIAHHTVNNNFLFSFFFNMVRPFLSERNRRKFFVHGNKIQNLHQHVNPNILPTILGGKLTLEDAIDTQLMNKLFSKGLYYKKLNDYGYMDTTIH